MALAISQMGYARVTSHMKIYYLYEFIAARILFVSLWSRHASWLFRSAVAMEPTFICIDHYSEVCIMYMKNVVQVESCERVERKMEETAWACVRPITILYIHSYTHTIRDHAYVGYLSAHKIVNSQPSDDPPRRVNEKATDHGIIKK